MKKLPMMKRIAMVCYLSFAVAWFGLSVFNFVFDSTAAQTNLDFNSAQLVEMQPAQKNGEFEITGGDPQLVFSGINLKARRVVLRAEFKRDPGELDLYYTKSETAGFSAAKRAWARPLEEWVYEYQLPPGTYHSLRLDMGSAGINEVLISSITLNEAAAPSWYFVPSMRDIMAFLIIPAIASCVIYIIMEIIAALNKKQGSKEQMPHKEN